MNGEGRVQGGELRTESRVLKTPSCIYLCCHPGGLHNLFFVPLPSHCVDEETEAQTRWAWPWSLGDAMLGPWRLLGAPEARVDREGPGLGLIWALPAGLGVLTGRWSSPQWQLLNLSEGHTSPHLTGS